jgi:hypothetical protein
MTGGIVGASQSGRLAARFGRTVLAVGLGLVAIGITAAWLVLASYPATGLHSWYLLAPLLSPRIGSGLFIAPNVDFIVATVDSADAGAASGVSGLMQRIGAERRGSGVQSQRDAGDDRQCRPEHRRVCSGFRPAPTKHTFDRRLRGRWALRESGITEHDGRRSPTALADTRSTGTPSPPT